MKKFTQLHLLTFYPASNLNRDDLGRPKTVRIGNATRLRISSQSLKRAWRTSDIFEEKLKDYYGCRTKTMGKTVYKKLMASGLDNEVAMEYARQIAGKFGKLKSPGKKEKEKDKLLELETEQLVHFTPEEQRAIDEILNNLGPEMTDLIEKIIKSKKNAEKEKLGKKIKKTLNVLRKSKTAVDIAMFGRMLADEPSFNTEAAVQVAHAFTVNKVQVEEDFFTAVDDLNSGKPGKFGDFFEAVDDLNDPESESAGAGHMGMNEFGAGVFYTYICIDRALLLENLGGDVELFNKNMEALVECAAKISPTGKQNSYASRAATSYILAENGTQQPRSLAVAFLKPVTPENDESQLETAIKKIRGTRNKIDKAYGQCWDEKEEMSVEEEKGELKDIISRVQEN